MEGFLNILFIIIIGVVIYRVTLWFFGGGKF